MPSVNSIQEVTINSLEDLSIDEIKVVKRQMQELYKVRAQLADAEAAVVVIGATRQAIADLELNIEGLLSGTIEFPVIEEVR